MGLQALETIDQHLIDHAALKVKGLPFNDTRYLKTDQTTPQTITGGAPVFSAGLTISNDTLFMNTNTANYFLMADGTDYSPVSPSDARTGLGLVAGGAGDIWVEKAGDTMTGPLIVGAGAAQTPLTVNLAASQSVSGVIINNSLSSPVAGFDSRGVLFSNLGTDSSNFFAGDGAGTTTIGVHNVGIGSGTLANATSGMTDNFAFGYYAMNRTSNDAADSNAVIGTRGFEYMTYGRRNTGAGYLVGRFLGYNVATCQDNTLFGYNTGSSSSGGAGNVAYNSGFGAYALTAIGAAIYDTAVGTWSLTSLTDGDYNSVLGAKGGYSLTTGSLNIFLGFSSGYNQTTTSDLLIIDNRQRADVATELTNAILYGVMASTPANQTLRLNAEVTTSGDLIVGIADSNKAWFGAGKDASILYNGTNLLINPKAVGTGYLNIQGQTLLDDKLMFTQTDGNEYIDSASDGHMTYGATVTHDFNNPLTIANIKSGATQAGAGASVSEIWRTSGHATLPDGVLMIGI